MDMLKSAEGIDRPEKISRKRKALYYVVMFFIVVLLAFLISEGVLRVFFKAHKVFSGDKLVKHRGSPHAKVGGSRLNSRGFLDVESDIEKPEGTYRIIALGDSFVRGIVGYEENFLSLLEAGSRSSIWASRARNLWIT
jgi:hypothetical protein